MDELPALTWMVTGLVTRQHGQEELQLARHALLDTCACIIAGASSTQANSLDTMLKAAGESGVASHALKLGVAAHAHDFDDYEEPGSTHPSAVLVPALLALADMAGPATLADILSAYIAGYETILTLGKVVGYAHYMAGWHATSTLGRPGAAIAAAKLLQLPAEQAVCAASLAMTQSAGLKAQFGTDAKALHAGLAARTGVEAALLARTGFSASAQIAQGPYGFDAMFGTHASPGWSSVRASGLASIARHPPFVKPSPSCGYTIRPIEAAIEIAASAGFNKDAIEHIEIRLPEPYHQVAGIADPATPHEARFSVSYCVAVALSDGEVGVAAFLPGAIQRTQVRALMARTCIDAYELPKGLGDMSPGAPDTVNVLLQDGTRFTETVALANGGPGRQMSSEQIAAKYVACGGSSATAARLLGASLYEPFDVRILI